MQVHKIFMVLAVVLVFVSNSKAQRKVIQGQVTDAKTGEPLSFATIGIRGTSVGTATNAEGRFVLDLSSELNDSILICSYMGYKNFEQPVKSIRGRLVIMLEADVIRLDEVEVRPWEPWDYVRNAMQKITENYANQPYLANGYYSEYMSENGIFLKFTEGVVQTYNPPYDQDNDSQSRVLKARRRDDLGTLQFMRQKIEKKYEKEKRKAEKNGEEWESKGSIDEEIVSASFGGPETVISSDPLRDTASFLDERYKKKFRYTIDGYSRYQGEPMIIIGFKSRGKYEHQKQVGKIYISLESDAIVSIEYDSKIVIPGYVRPILFVMGYGITNPEFSATIHYKPIGNQWYLGDFALEGGTRLTKKKMFSKNDRSQFDISMMLVNNDFQFESVEEIPEDERIDTDKPLEEQVEPDPDFWKGYKVVRPSRFSE